MMREQFETKYNTRMIEERLKIEVGASFEMHAQFILERVFPGYQKTKLQHDDGVDGFIYYRKHGNRRDNIRDFFSLYCPEAKTKWTQRLKNITADLKSIIDYASIHQIKISKWHPVINFELATKEYEEIVLMCERYNIEFEVLHPSKLIRKLAEKECLFQVACYFDLVFEERPYTDYSFHVFSKKALQDIREAQSQSVPFHKKHTMLSEILTYIFLFADLRKTGIPIRYLKARIEFRTQIPKEFIRCYEYINGEFIQVNEIPEMTLHDMYKTASGCTGFIMRNLFPLYRLVIELERQLMEKGNYNLDETLDGLYKKSIGLRFITDKVSCKSEVS